MQKMMWVGIGLLVAVGACVGDEVEPDVALKVTAAGSTAVSLAIIEGGQPMAIAVSLDRDPHGTVVVEVSADPVVALDRTRLTFTSADFDVPQPVVLSAVDDADVLDEAGEITLAASASDSFVIPIAVADDDRVTLVGLPTELLVMEGGTATFGVALAADPGGTVTVALASSATADATVSPATLTFGANWAVPQTVTVTGVADGDDVDDEVTLSLGGLHVAGASVAVTALDVQRQNFVIAPTALDLVEGGAAGTFTVRLTQPPSGSLTIDVAVGDPAIAGATPASLTFTAANYAVAQTVTVSPQVDIDGVADLSSVALTSAGLRDRAVALRVAEDATVDVTDVSGDFLMTVLPDESPGITFRWQVTYTIDPVLAALSFSATPLRFDDGTPIGIPTTGGGLLGEDGSFTSEFDGELPAEANELSQVFNFVDAAIAGQLVDSDFLCGTMSGSAGGTPLGGTWGAVRITGPTLPPSVVACP